MGGCGLHTHNGELELGYWYGKPYWKMGYATEAARRVLEFAFDELKAPAVWAGWFHDNPNSGHVLGKLASRRRVSRRVPAWRAAWMSAATSSR